WCPGQPDAAAPDEDYVEIASYPGWCVGSWNDQGATDLRTGIIERPFDPSTSRILTVGSPGGYATLQAAIDAAFPGDIIDGFQAGDAEVFLTKSLMLRNGRFDLGQVNHRLLRITGTSGI